MRWHVHSRRAWRLKGARKKKKKKKKGGSRSVAFRLSPVFFWALFFPFFFLEASALRRPKEVELTATGAKQIEI
jgi:hypothetical protein